MYTATQAPKQGQTSRLPPREVTALRGGATEVLRVQIEISDGLWPPSKWNTPTHQLPLPMETARPYW
ncbi:hypothetical protein EYF80_027319 [Liparis tanakae]|uniref:Uncharacterized protein n=1 Tax=Liparis tanakae TaxID=230148 RepID=A0A4Z2H9W8_9TELE|nr:hypothetical protein EYF80_027319 [Liparis tanakae]